MTPQQTFEKIEQEESSKLVTWQTKWTMSDYEADCTALVGHVYEPLMRHRFERMARLLDAAKAAEQTQLDAQTQSDLKHIADARTTLLYAVSTGDADAVLTVLAPLEGSFSMYRKGLNWPTEIKSADDDDDADDADDADDDDDAMPVASGVAKVIKSPAGAFACGVLLTLVGQRVMR